jgi:glycosyltransferase involved in cell wall biosynthesis
VKHPHNEITEKFPLVSIGLPVFNNQNLIRKAIQSITSQSFQNWELIVSDNNSSDETVKIIEELIKSDDRIFLYKQKSNIGMYPNFKFVLDKARGKYFHWLAADDSRSKNFLDENISFLESNEAFVASCSKKYIGGIDKIQNQNTNFSIEHSIAFQRISYLLDNIWQSHSVYYSVIRTLVIKKCQFLGEHFLAQDWIIDVHLAKHGKIALQNSSYIIIGEEGVSRVNPFKPFRLYWIEFIIPLFTFHLKFNYLIADFSLLEKFKLQLKIIFLHSFFVRAFFMKRLRKFIKGLIKR